MSDYDEDFEDYDEDFESDTELEAPELQKPDCQDEEGLSFEGLSFGAPGAAQAAPRAWTSKAVRAELTEQQRRRLEAAVQKQPLVALQQAAMEDMYAQQGQSQHQLFSQGRGQYARLRPAATQTMQLGRDAQQQDCQTEEVETSEAGCQAPDAGGSCGAARRQQQGQRDAAPTWGGAAAQDQQQGSAAGGLGAFLKWAAPAVLRQLARQQPGGGGGARAQLRPSPHPELGSGFLQLQHEALLAGRPVTALAHCPVAGSTLLACAYGPVAMAPEQLLKDHSMRAQGLLCVWDLAQPAEPAEVLLLEGGPSCCCWAPAASGAGADLVFAGTCEGGLCMWDLREPLQHHAGSALQLPGGAAVRARRPSYCSEGSSELLLHAAGPVVALQAACAAGGKGAGLASSRGVVCQLLALTAEACVQQFSVLQLSPLEQQAAAAAATGQWDCGLRFGSSVRLLRSSQLQLQQQGTIPWGSPHAAALDDPAPLGLAGGRQAHCMALLTGGAQQQLLAGLQGGHVRRASLAGCVLPPSLYSCAEYVPGMGAADAAPSSAGAMSLDVCPRQPDLFLVGCSSGAVSVHRLSQAHALLELPAALPAAVLAVRWLPARPACFVALDAAGALHLFDLGRSRSRAVAVLQLGDAQQGRTAGAAGFCTALEVSSSDGCSSSTTQSHPCSGSSAALLLVGLRSGAVQCHQQVPAAGAAAADQAGLAALRAAFGM